MKEPYGSGGTPEKQGLYDPAFERDACGLGFIASIKGVPSHDIILKGIQILVNLQHRGASGSDPVTGDGAGLLIQIPHAFFERECASCGFTLPLPGEYGVGMMFLPVDRHQRLMCEGIVERVIREEGLHLLGWRDTPLSAGAIGRVARATQPYIEQVFIRRAPGMDPESLERRLYIVRKRIEAEVDRSDLRDGHSFGIPSLSSRTIVYKGLLLATQIGDFYRELADPLTESALCLVHQRFSTNTFPAWKLAHPFHMLCHNGEINTLKGNLGWMEARQSILASPLFGEEIGKLFPVAMPGGSDSAILDNVLELLVMSGRSLPHAMAMLVPEAWDGDDTMPAPKKAFYEYHASLMEPWDGPAAIAFTDGRVIGATLDRNGLRPARYIVTSDDMVVMASEAGVLPARPEETRLKGRLQPGRMLLVDMEEGRIIPDAELKDRLARRRPYAEWLRENQTTIDDLPDPSRWHPTEFASILQRQREFGYTHEELRRILTPMASEGQEPVGSMGIDTPLACLSDRPQLLFNYFKQQFAQVTNPAIDPIREELVMSLTSFIGVERNLLEETPRHCHTLKLGHPILTNHDLEKLRRLSWGDFLATTLPMFFRVGGGGGGTRKGPDRVVPARFPGDRVRVHDADPLRPRDRGRLCPHPQPAGPDRGSQPPDPRKDPDPGGPHRGIGGASGGDAFRPPAGIRRQRREPLPGAGIDRGPPPARMAAGGARERGGDRGVRKGREQGAAEGPVQDGDLDAAELPGGPGLRGDRARPVGHRALFHRHPFENRGGRTRRARRRGQGQARLRLPGPLRLRGGARNGRGVPIQDRGGIPFFQPRDHFQPAALGALVEL
jgi:glutamate synthase domain-containing protein 1